MTAWNNVHTLNHFIMNVHISPSYMTFSFPPGMKLVLSYVSNGALCVPDCI